MDGPTHKERSSDGLIFQSCLIKRFCEKRFIAKYMATIGIDYGVTKYALSINFI